MNKSCDNCKHEHVSSWSIPCCHCETYQYWEPAEDQRQLDRIERMLELLVSKEEEEEEPPSCQSCKHEDDWSTGQLTTCHNCSQNHELWEAKEN